MKRTVVLVLVAIPAAFFVGRMSVNSDKHPAKEQAVAEDKTERVENKTEQNETKQKTALATTIAILSACHICANGNECLAKDQVVTEYEVGQRDEDEIVEEKIYFATVTRDSRVSYEKDFQTDMCRVDIADEGGGSFGSGNFAFSFKDSKAQATKCALLKKGDRMEIVETVYWTRARQYKPKF